MMERIRALVAERLAAARALIDSFRAKPPEASGDIPEETV